MTFRQHIYSWQGPSCRLSILVGGNFLMNQFLITTSLVTENPPKKVKDCSVVVACL